MRSPSASFWVESPPWAARLVPGAWAGIQAALAINPAIDHDPDSMLIAFAHGAPPDARDGALAAVGGEIVRTYTLVPGLFCVQVGVGADQALAILRESPGVRYAEPNRILYAAGIPTDTRFGEPWALNNTGQSVNGSAGKVDADIDAPEAWDIYTGDPNFAVAIIDNGVLFSHPDLAADIWTNPGE